MDIKDSKDGLFETKGNLEDKGAFFRDLIFSLENDDFYSYALDTAVLALFIVSIVSFYTVNGFLERVLLFLLIIPLKIPFDLLLKFYKVLFKIPRKIMVFMFSLLFIYVFLAPMMRSTYYTTGDFIKNFNLSPESAIGEETVHVEHLEGNVYAAYWDTGLYSGIAFLENDFNGYRWNVLLQMRRENIIGAPFWFNTLQYEVNNQAYHVAIFKTYETQIRHISISFREEVINYLTNSIKENTNTETIEVNSNITFITWAAPPYETKPDIRVYSYLQLNNIFTDQNGIEFNWSDTRYRFPGGYEYE